MGTSSTHSVVLLGLISVHLVFGLQHHVKRTPPFPYEPFLTVWNAPTANCLSRYGVDLDLSLFNIVHNQDQSFMGGNITIFYEKSLGLYPRYTDGEAIYGGVPQNASLAKHLRAAAEDINVHIPDRDFQGLAVVDWESWRPIWERNWADMRIYWKASMELVEDKHPDWSPEQIKREAMQQFEKAAREIMEATLELGKKERPKGLWGYYGFPSCYNADNIEDAEYKGECPPIEKKRNDELSWLWQASTALYPDIYLSMELNGLGDEVLRYTQNRILEAMRVGQLMPSPLPVLPYTRFVYTYSMEFLSQEHLVYTIGESAALGSAGVVLWGDGDYAESQASCEAVKDYIDGTLGHYLVNVTSAATLCSQHLCSSNGRCQRRDPNSRAYLHLDPTAWTVVTMKKPEGGQDYSVFGQMTLRQVADTKDNFQCKCFPGWVGGSCSKPSQG